MILGGAKWKAGAHRGRKMSLGSVMEDELDNDP